MITQIITLSVLCIQYKGVLPEEDRFLSRKNELVVSSTKNVLVFVPDTFDGYLMSQMLEKYPEETAGSLEDFTFYPDTVAGAARTKYATNVHFFTPAIRTTQRSAFKLQTYTGRKK